MEQKMYSVDKMVLWIAIVFIVIVGLIFLTMLVVDSIPVRFSGGFMVEFDDIRYVNISGSNNTVCPFGISEEYCPMPSRVVISRDLDVPLNIRIINKIFSETR